MPARQFFPTRFCVLLTFLASGAFHEYVWTCIFYHHKDKLNSEGVCDEGCYEPAFFKLTAFFVWCGAMCVAERFVSNYGIFQWMASNLPKFVIATLVVLLALPFSHWYTGDWAKGQFFTDFSVYRISFVFKPVSSL